MTSTSLTAYILFHGRFPSEKAASLFVAENAEALSKHCKVTVVVPNRRVIGAAETNNAFQVSPEIKIITLPTVDVFSWKILGRLPFWISSIVFSWHAYFFLRKNMQANDVIFANDLIPGLVAVSTSRNTIYEVHDYPERHKNIYRYLFSKVRLLIATNIWKAQKLAEDFPATRGSILMERNGVNMALFKDRDKEEARVRVGITTTGPIAVYTGHLYSWKGVDTLLSAAKRMPNLQFYFVGGTQKDVATHVRAWKGVHNIHFVGHVPHANVPLWQSAADVLVLPNTGTQDISTKYTSPMKLFEYMASGRPIVASNLPSIVEVIGTDLAYLFTPDDAGSLVNALNNALNDGVQAQQRARAARIRAEHYTWEKRAQRIIEKLSIL